MKKLTVEEFVSEIESTIQHNFGKYRIEVLLQSARSFKANVHTGKNVFIAIRYNSRNERMDFALIKNKKRIFGYDNLKQWHFHPHTNPSEHIPCKKPTIAEIISDIKSVHELTM